MRHLEAVKREGNWSGVKIENVTDDLGVLSVAGPLSPMVMDKCLQGNKFYEQACALRSEFGA